MRIASILALSALVTASLAAPPAAAIVDPIVVKFPDGITAKITFPGSVADLVLVPDAAGNVPVQLSLYKVVGGAWQQVSLRATLRAFAAVPEADLFAKSFLSSATGPVTVDIPASRLAGANFYDVFVTFSNEPGLPTSHHNVVKNALIDQGLLNTADYLDYHGTHRPLLLALPAAPEVPAVPPLPPLPPLPVDAACIAGGADPASCVALPA